MTKVPACTALTFCFAGATPSTCFSGGKATSRLLERGLDVVEVAPITGHRMLTILAWYTHLKSAKLDAKLG